MGNNDTKVGNGEPRCYAYVIGSTGASLRRTQEDLHEAAKIFKENGCTVIAATKKEPENVDKYIEPTWDNVDKLFSGEFDEMDGNDTLFIYQNDHGDSSCFTLADGACYSYERLVDHLKSRSFAKGAAIHDHCQVGIAVKKAYKNVPRMLVMAAATNERTVYDNDFLFFKKFPKTPDINGNSFSELGEAFLYQRYKVNTPSTPSWIRGWAYYDTGVRNPASISHPFPDKVVDVDSYVELNEKLKSLGNNFAIVKYVYGTETEEELKFFELQAKAAGGSVAFYRMVNRKPLFIDAVGSRLYGGHIHKDGIKLNENDDDPSFPLYRVQALMTVPSEENFKKAVRYRDWEVVKAILENRSIRVATIEEKHKLFDWIYDLLHKGVRLPKDLLLTIFKSGWSARNLRKAFSKLLSYNDSEKEIIKVLEYASHKKQTGIFSDELVMMVYERHKKSKLSESIIEEAVDLATNKQIKQEGYEILYADFNGAEW